MSAEKYIFSRLQGLQREEVILTADIRAAAKNGNEAGTRVLAKQLVRLREHKIQLQMTMAGLRGVRNTLSVSSGPAPLVVAPN